MHHNDCNYSIQNILFYFVCGRVCAHVSVHVFVCEHAEPWGKCWKSSSITLYIFFFETSPLTESAVCCFSWTSWPVSSGHPPVSTPGTGVKDIYCHAQLSCDAGELTSRSPISTANTHPPSHPPSLKHPF